MKEIVNRGPGWTVRQIKEKQKLTEELQLEKCEIEKKQALLQRLQTEIYQKERKIRDVDCLRDQTMKKLKETDESIESTRERVITEKGLKSSKENEEEMYKMRIQQGEEDLVDLKAKLSIENEGTDTEEELIRKYRSEIERYSREEKQARKKIERGAIEVRHLQQANEDIVKENNNRFKNIQDNKTETELLTLESEKILRQKEFIEEKIKKLDLERTKNEYQKDELKLRINKVESVESKQANRDCEDYKRQKECLKRDMDLLDRKKILSAKSSTGAFDLVKSNERSLKHLSNELDGLRNSARKLEKDVAHSRLLLQKGCQEAIKASQKLTEAVSLLQEEEGAALDLHKQVQNADVSLKQKKAMCDAMKSECNMRGKILVEKKDEIDKVKKELNVLCRQTSQLKLEISRAENSLVHEHYHHHHTDKENNTLREDLKVLQCQILESDKRLVVGKTDLQLLGRNIDEADQGCHKSLKEYNDIIGDRDTIGSLLVKSNEELERIQEKIKIQESALRHSEVEYQELITSLTELILRLKDLHAKKNDVGNQAHQNQSLQLEIQGMETELQREKVKTITLREECGQPLNIHRWRSLEHSDPQTYEKILRVQKLQKKIIDTSEKVVMMDRKLLEKEILFSELKSTLDTQMDSSMLNTELDLHQTELDEKKSQMKDIGLDLQIQKRRVDDLKEELVEIERKRRRLNLVDTSEEMLR